jgi:hypothetical protein
LRVNPLEKIGSKALWSKLILQTILKIILDNIKFYYIDEEMGLLFILELVIFKVFSKLGV